MPRDELVNRTPTIIDRFLACLHSTCSCKITTNSQAVERVFHELEHARYQAALHIVQKEKYAASVSEKAAKFTNLEMTKGQLSAPNLIFRVISHALKC